MHNSGEFSSLFDNLLIDAMRIDRYPYMGRRKISFKVLNSFVAVVVEGRYENSSAHFVSCNARFLGLSFPTC